MAGKAQGRRCLVSLLVGALAYHGTANQERADELKRSLQDFLDSYVTTRPTLAVQLGWKSATEDFGLAAGQYRRPDEDHYRPATAKDTYLFGSGTKPITASAVYSLVSKGLVSLDDPLAKHVDPVLSKIAPGLSMTTWFGSRGAKVTVGQTLHMTSGILDYDIPEYDVTLLWANLTYKVHPPWEPISYVSNYTKSPTFACEPGTCVQYSSTNYILLGFVLLAHSPADNWFDIDVMKFFPKPIQEKLSKVSLFQKEMLNEHLVVPGHAAGGWGGYPNTTLYNQSSSILGWTCGNMAAAAHDVAVFYWNLLGPEKNVVPEAMIKDMTKFKPINKGWASGEIQYGGGLMIRNYNGGWNYTSQGPPMYDRIGQAIGHGGDTFGFLSEQGILFGLNASISIIINHDSGVYVGTDLMCHATKIATKVLLGRETPEITCQKAPPTDAEVMLV